MRMINPGDFFLESVGFADEPDFASISSLALLAMNEDSGLDEMIVLLAKRSPVRLRTAMPRLLERLACGVVLAAATADGIDETRLIAAARTLRSLEPALRQLRLESHRVFVNYDEVLRVLRDARLALIDLARGENMQAAHLAGCMNAVIYCALRHPQFTGALLRQSLRHFDAGQRTLVQQRSRSALALALGEVSRVDGVPEEVCKLVRLRGLLQHGDRFRQAASFVRSIVEEDH